MKIYKYQSAKLTTTSHDSFAYQHHRSIDGLMLITTLILVIFSPQSQ